ncbi:hypothetical protein F0562_025580 [Nyssa sinensis]|uniref:Uncharacterized protein n=1 Tax=Nyssa sinensis TaxID=561372 RepID=A0A5J5B8H6_9ASTE|nr:hypothetical protein F0562_025580 [Nyssa sinensis]
MQKYEYEIMGEKFSDKIKQRRGENESLQSCCCLFHQFLSRIRSTRGIWQLIWLFPLLQKLGSTWLHQLGDNSAI